jgi:hypothetical protein
MFLLPSSLSPCLTLYSFLSLPPLHSLSATLERFGGVGTQHGKKGGEALIQHITHGAILILSRSFFHLIQSSFICICTPWHCFVVHWGTRFRRNLRIHLNYVIRFSHEHVSQVKLTRAEALKQLGLEDTPGIIKNILYTIVSSCCQKPCLSKTESVALPIRGLFTHSFLC